MKVIKRKSYKPQTGDEKVKYYHSKYITYSRAIAVLWAVLVVCFLVVCLVAFIQAAWIGTHTDRAGQGHFGLWQYYLPNELLDGKTVREQYVQHGEFLNFDLIPSGHFKAATVFVGLTVLLMMVCVICLFLFFCISAKIVFTICGWILVFCAIFLFLACVIYPGGFEADVVRNVCNSSSYNKGTNCYIQWAYVLAIIGIFDAIVLAILAFVLAFRQVKLLPWQEKMKPETVFIVDDKASRHNGTMRSNGPQAVRPVVITNGRAESMHSQPVGTMRSHRSHTGSRQNFKL